MPDDDAVEDLLRVLEMFRQPPAERSAARRMIVVGAEPKYSGTVELKEAEGHSDSESQLFRTLGTMTPNRFVNSPTTGIWRLLLADHAWTPKNRAGDSSEAIRASSGNPGDSRTYRSEERGESLELEPEVFEMECHP